MPLIDLNGLGYFKGKENAMVAGAYSATKTYAVGDYCYYSGILYRCTTAITSGEAWTSGHWAAAKLAEDLTSKSEKITKSVSLTNNATENIAVNYTTVTGLFISTAGVLTTLSSGAQRTICINAEPNKTYRIKKSTATVVRVGCGSSASLAATAQLKYYHGHSSSSSDELWIKTDSLNHYIYIQLFDNSDSAALQSIEANVSTLVVNEYTDFELDNLDSLTTEETDNIFYITEPYNNADGVTVENVKVTLLDDGSYLFNGTASARVRMPCLGSFNRNEKILPAGTYTFGWEKISGTTSSPESVNFSILAGGTSTSNAVVREGKESTTITFANNVECVFNIGNGMTLTNYRVKLWCTVGSTRKNFIPTKTAKDFVARKSADTQIAHLRIASYNVGNWNYGLEDIGMEDSLVSTKLPTWRKLLGDMKVDILCMQEYTTKLDRSATVDAYEQLFEPLYPHYVTDGVASEEHDGLAIMSKWKFNYSKAVEISDSIINVKRKVLHMNITVAGKELNILCFVLINYGKAQEKLTELGIVDKTPQDVQKEELEAIINYATGMQNVILAGDYNIRSYLETLQPLTDAGYKIGNGGYFGWQATSRNSYQTDDPTDGYPNDNVSTLPNITIDYINAYYPAYALATSDHLPFFVDITVT